MTNLKISTKLAYWKGKYMNNSVLYKITKILKSKISDTFGPVFIYTELNLQTSMCNRFYFVIMNKQTKTFFSLINFQKGRMEQHPF